MSPLQLNCLNDSCLFPYNKFLNMALWGQRVHLGEALAISYHLKGCTNLPPQNITRAFFFIFNIYDGGDVGAEDPYEGCLSMSCPSLYTQFFSRPQGLSWP